MEQPTETNKVSPTGYWKQWIRKNRGKVILNQSAELKKQAMKKRSLEEDTTYDIHNQEVGLHGERNK